MSTTPRLQVLVDKEASSYPLIIPYPHDVGMRRRCVDMMFRLCKALRLEWSTPSAAVRVFDRYLSTAPPDALVNETYMNLAGAVCVDIAGKTIDIDASSCGHKNAMAIYGDHVPRHSMSKNTFAKWFIRMEMDVMRALNFDPIPPTAFEYISECTNWFDPWNASRAKPRKVCIGDEAASRAYLYCDAFCFSEDSLKYASWEIGGAGAYMAAERCYLWPVETNPGCEMLPALWKKTSWLRGRKLVQHMKHAVEDVFQEFPEGGFVQFHKKEWEMFCTRQTY